MIPDLFKQRFAGDTGVDIASQEIDVLFPDGERRRIRLRLGAPFRRGRQTRIRTELENLDRTDGPIGGAGTFHTLILGVAWIVGRLEVFENRLKCLYFWPDSDERFDYLDFFATTAFRMSPRKRQRNMAKKVKKGSRTRRYRQPR